MRNIAKCLCLLLISALLLTGCDLGVVGDAMDAAKDTVSEKTFTNGGITMTLTSKFLDFSKIDGNEEEYTFFYSSDTHAIFAIDELKADVAQYGAVDAKSYTALIAQLYELNVEPEEKEGKFILTYEADEEDGSKLTFVCMTLETADSFVFIQASCPSEQYEADQAQIWSWLTSATVSES